MVTFKIQLCINVQEPHCKRKSLQITNKICLYWNEKRDFLFNRDLSLSSLHKKTNYLTASRDFCSGHWNCWLSFNLFLKQNQYLVVHSVSKLPPDCRIFWTGAHLEFNLSLNTFIVLIIFDKVLQWFRKYAIELYEIASKERKYKHFTNKRAIGVFLSEH